MARSDRPSAGEVARRELRAAVNFGVVAVADVLGTPAGDRLVLRCECGSDGCEGIVRISIREYRRLERARAPLTAHADASSPPRAGGAG